jgi:antitoxin YefM
MRQMAVNEFRSTLRESVEAVVRDHEPLRVTRRTGEAFVVISEADWRQQQETLYVLQNRSLMQQIAQSLATHQAGTGYTPPQELLDEACNNL